MAALTRGLTTVRTEFNTVFPGRDKTSDGWIGNLAHQTGTSGHNPDRTGRAEYKDGDGKDEVRAIDVDKDLRSVVTMEQVVQYLIKRARIGIYVPLRYVIYRGRIWSRADGWKTRTYTGKNKHNEHAHLSGDYTQKADEWTGSLGLASLLPREDDMPTADEVAEAVYAKLVKGDSKPWTAEQPPSLASAWQRAAGTGVQISEVRNRLTAMENQLSSLGSTLQAIRTTLDEHVNEGGTS